MPPDSITNPSPKRRRRGKLANPNNSNRGFYAGQFRQGENEDLDAILTSDLQDEIAMVRVLTRRVFALADGASDLTASIDLLGALSLSATRLASLLKSRRILSGEDNSISESISEALTQVVSELRIKHA